MIPYFLRHDIISHDSCFKTHILIKEGCITDLQGNTFKIFRLFLNPVIYKKKKFQSVTVASSKETFR